MTRCRTRHILGVALAVLLLVTACGGGSSDDETTGGGAQDGGNGPEDGGNDPEDGGDVPESSDVNLTLERIAELDLPPALDLIATDTGILALPISYKDESRVLTRIDPDGTVTELADLYEVDPFMSLFTTDAGAFASLSTDAGCGYAPVDPTTGALGETVLLDPEPDCYPSRPSRLDATEVAFLSGERMVIVDTADGTSKEVALDDGPDTTTANSRDAIATEDAIFVTSTSFDDDGRIVSSSVQRLGRDGTPGPTADIPGMLSIAGPFLLVTERSDADAEEYAYHLLDPETLETEPIDDPEPYLTCPRGDLRFQGRDEGTWTLHRGDEDRTSVLLVDPQDCAEVGSVDLEPLPEETDETRKSTSLIVVDDNLYLLRRVLHPLDDDYSTPEPEPLVTVLERVTVA